MSETTKLADKLQMKKKNIFENADAEKIQSIFDFSDDYMAFLDEAKTEREATDFAIELAKAKGFTEYRLGDKLNVGDKKYYNYRRLRHPRERPYRQRRHGQRSRSPPAHPHRYQR